MLILVQFETLWLLGPVFILINQLTVNQCSLLHRVHQTPSDISIPIKNATLETGANSEYSQKLLQILGLEDHVERRSRHLSAPQFMIDLYKTLADPETGTISRPKPYQADTVWAFHHSELHKNHLHFHFNVTQNKFNGKEILEAEFHIFKVKPKRRMINLFRPKTSKTQLLEVQLHQLLTGDVHGEKKLLDSRRMTINSVGWEMFYVKKALLDWIQGKSPNYGLLITVKSISGEELDDHFIRWVNGHHHQINKRPILVVYTVDQGKKKLSSPKNTSKPDYSTNGFSELFLKYGQPSDSESSEASDEDVKSGKTKGLADSLLDLPTFSPVTCSRVGYTVSVEKLGWLRFVIYPKNLNIYGCQGDCGGGLRSRGELSKHAIFQSLIGLGEAQPSNKINPVSCVPNSLEPLDMLYFSADGNIILRQIDDLVVSQCSCQ